MQAGDQIGVWVVQKPLGRGGFGSVYRCYNRLAPKIFAAIKLLDRGLAEHPIAQQRFFREAELLFALEHPNIVKVRNLQFEGDAPYIEMEFVEGISLEAMLRRGPIAEHHAIALMQQLASAVDYLHQQEIYHRDIKPSNIIIRPDKVLKLVDFGVAVDVQEDRLTQLGARFGTVSYAPPEWSHPERLQPPHWDIYGMGMVFYEMLTGEVGFAVPADVQDPLAQAMEVMTAKLREPYLSLGPQYHQALRDLVTEMTSREPENRPSSSNVLERLQVLDPHASNTLMDFVTVPISRSVFAPQGSMPSPLTPAPASASTDEQFAPHRTSVPQESSRRWMYWVGGIVATLLVFAGCNTAFFLVIVVVAVFGWMVT